MIREINLECHVWVSDFLFHFSVEVTKGNDFMFIYQNVDSRRSVVVERVENTNKCILKQHQVMTVLLEKIHILTRFPYRKGGVLIICLRWLFTCVKDKASKCTQYRPLTLLVKQKKISTEREVYWSQCNKGQQSSALTEFWGYFFRQFDSLWFHNNNTKENVMNNNRLSVNVY